MSAVHDEALALLDQLEPLMSQMVAADPTGRSHSIADVGRHHLQAFRSLIATHEAYIDPEAAEARRLKAIIMGWGR